MHELGITQSLIEICTKEAHGARVLRVRLQVGALCAVLPDALHFCFATCTAGTLLEGAELLIEETPDEDLQIRNMEVARWA